MVSLDRAPSSNALAAPMQGPGNGRNQVYVHDVTLRELGGLALLKNHGQAAVAEIQKNTFVRAPRSHYRPYLSL
jgi:hypothetical protein